MAVRTHEEFMTRVREFVGDRVDDDALSFIEDATDTYNDYASKSGEDWRKKYENIDSVWREKYRSRFFSGDDKARSVEEAKITTPAVVLSDQDADIKLDGEEVTFESLFENRQG